MATATVTGLTLIEDMEGTPTITNIGGGPGATTTNDIFIEGGQAIGRRVNTTGAIRGFGVDFAAIDFTVAGRLLWVWWNAALGPDGADTLANGGMRIRVSSTLGGGSNYHEYYVGGGDVTVAGWNRTIIDVNNLTASVTNGTLVKTAVVNVTITYLYNTAPGGNIPHVVLDALHYGDTITVTGGTSGDPLTWEDVSIATEVSAWGVLRQPPGASFYLANGDISFGGASSDCYLDDEQQIIEWQDQQYYYSTGLSSSVPTTFQGISVTNGTTNTCSFVDGQQIGTGDDTTGGGGSIFQVPPDSLTPMHFVASDADVQFMKLYGTSLRRAQDRVEFKSGSISGSDHSIAGVTFGDCAQVQLGEVFTRNTAFQGYSGPSASLLWNPDIDIKNCAFRGASSSLYDSAGIEHDTTGSFNYLGLTFTNNEFDILNSTAGGQVDITASLGANPTTTTASNGGTTNILNAVSHTVTDLEPGSRVVWIRNSDDAELANETESGGNASYTYNYTGDVSVDVQILSLNFRNKIVTVTLGSEDATLPASQTDDRTYFNP